MKNRYGILSILFLVGFTISSFVLSITADIADRIRKEERSNNVYNYNESFFLSPGGADITVNEEAALEQVNSIIPLLGELNCGARFADIGVSIDNQIDDTFVNLVMNQNGDFELTLDTGEKMSAGSQADTVYIGESLAESNLHAKENLLNIGKWQMHIGGILRNESAAGVDYRVFAFWDSCSEDVRQYFINMMAERLSMGVLRVDLYGNAPINDEVSKLESELSALSISCEDYVPSYTGNDYQNYWYRYYNGIFVCACLIFSVVTCLSLSYLWISGRRKEIATRKIYGYGNGPLIGMLSLDIFKLEIPAVLLSVLLEVLFCAALHDFSFFTSGFLGKLLMICVCMILIGLLCVVGMVAKVAAIPPIEAIREET